MKKKDQKYGEIRSSLDAFLTALLNACEMYDASGVHQVHNAATPCVRCDVGQILAIPSPPKKTKRKARRLFPLRYDREVKS